MVMKYPIKYAVLEVKEQGGYLQGYKKVILGYIASKCYVLSSAVIYSVDGTLKTSNIVFFPYNNIKNFKNSNLESDEKDTIRFNYNMTPWPVEIVVELFDTFEEAKENAEEKNNELRKNLMFNRPVIYVAKGYEELVREFESDLEVCRRYEEFIDENTTDMIITKDEIGKCKVKN
ncbi:MAG: hypothetical protein IJK66_01475 [Bacilli bacterium]|nr:hypothetical protein [Bacilli bacterium]